MKKYSIFSSYHLFVVIIYLIYTTSIFLYFFNSEQGHIWFFRDYGEVFHEISNIYLQLIKLNFFQQNEIFLSLFGYIFFIFLGSIWWYFLSFIFLKISYIIAQYKHFFILIIYISLLCSWIYYLYQEFFS